MSLDRQNDTHGVATRRARLTSSAPRVLSSRFVPTTIGETARASRLLISRRPSKGCFGTADRALPASALPVIAPLSCIATFSVAAVRSLTPAQRE